MVQHRLNENNIFGPELIFSWWIMCTFEMHDTPMFNTFLDQYKPREWRFIMLLHPVWTYCIKMNGPVNRKYVEPNGFPLTTF